MANELTAEDLTRLEASLADARARLDQAYLNEELRKPPLIRVELALWALNNGPALVALAREALQTRAVVAAAETFFDARPDSLEEENAAHAICDAVVDLRAAREETR